MRKLFVLFLLLACFAAPVFAQVSSSEIIVRPTKPASCTNTRRILHLTQIDGANQPGIYRCNGSTFVPVGAAGAGTGDVTGPGVSVDNEFVLWSSTGGTAIKRATFTGLLKATSGVGAVAVAGTDYLTPSGNGSALTALNASNLGSGTVPTARLGSGTANSSSFLRGDQTWQAISATPAGSDTQVQRNNAGSFGAVTGVTSDGTNMTAGSGNFRATRPRITTSIDDANGNEVIITPATASAVNEITVTNGATGTGPTIAATGGDTNIDLNVAAKGSGKVRFGAASTGFVGLLDTDATHYLDITPGSNLTADRTFTITTGDANTVLNTTAVTDGFVMTYDTGTGSWRGEAAAGGAGTVAVKEEFLSVGSCTSAAGTPTLSNWYFDTGTGAPLGCRGNTFAYGEHAFTELATVHIPFTVPAEWTSGAVTLTLYGTSGGAEAGMTVDVSTKCIADGEAFETVTYNTAQTITVTNGTAGNALTFSQTGLTMTGCAAGENLMIKVKRTDPETNAFYLHKAGVKFVIP